jgi:hypothetical protein
MTKVSKPWQIAAFLFVLVNVGGGIYAAAMGEWMHGFAHVAALAAGFMGWQFFAYRGEDAEEMSELPPPEARLDSLQNAVDSIALNVERIGEAQRYQEKLVRERAAKSS